MDADSFYKNINLIKLILLFNKLTNIKRICNGNLTEYDFIYILLFYSKINQTIYVAIYIEHFYIIILHNVIFYMYRLDLFNLTPLFVSYEGERELFCNSYQ